MSNAHLLPALRARLFHEQWTSGLPSSCLKLLQSPEDSLGHASTCRPLPERLCLHILLENRVWRPAPFPTTANETKSLRGCLIRAWPEAPGACSWRPCTRQSCHGHTHTHHAHLRPCLMQLPPASAPRPHPHPARSSAHPVFSLVPSTAF